MFKGELVTVRIKKENYSPSAMIFKKFDIIKLRHGPGRKDVVFNMLMEDADIQPTGSVTLSLRRLDIEWWWPAREIQLWAIRKAFKNQI